MKFVSMTVLFIGKRLYTNKEVAYREIINLRPDQIGKEGSNKKALRLMRKRFPKTLYYSRKFSVIKK